MEQSIVIVTSTKYFQLLQNMGIAFLEVIRPFNKMVPSHTFMKKLTREPLQLIHADFVHILSIYRGHHAKKKPKRIWVHAVSFEDYGHFTDFSAYDKGVYVKIK